MPTIRDLIYNIDENNLSKTVPQIKEILFWMFNEILKIEQFSSIDGHDIKKIKDELVLLVAVIK